MKRIIALLVVALSLSVGHLEAAERIFHRVGTDDPATLDPHKVALPGEQLVTLDLFMSLSTPGMNGRPIPGAAESWTVSPDGKTYLFKLRPNSRWSDGKPLTAEDWVWSFRRMLDPATAFPLASRLFPIRNAPAVATGSKTPAELGVSAPDARTVRIELENPAPYLLDSMMAAAMPVPRHVIEKHGAAWIRPENLVSNGPFVLQEWRPNAYVRLRRNANFWAADRVRLDGVYHYPISDGATLLRRFNAGELDFVMVVPPDRAAALQAAGDPRLKVMRGLANEVIVFNTRSGPTADVRVRRALSMLIEREAIARGVIGFPGVEGYSFVPPGVLNYGEAAKPDFAAWPASKRLAEARRLLAAAGYTSDKPLRLRLGFPNTDLNRKVAVTVGSMWSRAGVKVDLESKESKALFAEIGKADFDAVRTVWVASASDPYAYLERMVSTGSAGAVNTSGYANPKFDERLEAASREADVQRRAAILRQAEAIALADQPVAPVYYLVGRRLVSSRVQGFADNPRGVYPTWMMTVSPR